MSLLEVRHLKKSFKKTVAVDDVSFKIEKGEAVGLVGESGCGKSTVAKLVTLLLKPDSGEILFEGADLRKMRGQSLKKFRQNTQIIFSDEEIIYVTHV